VECRTHLLRKSSVSEEVCAQGSTARWTFIRKESTGQAKQHTIIWTAGTMHPLHQTQTHGPCLHRSDSDRDPSQGRWPLPNQTLEPLLCSLKECMKPSKDTLQLWVSVTWPLLGT
jgi:hypothetical protein